MTDLDLASTLRVRVTVCRHENARQHLDVVQKLPFKSQIQFAYVANKSDNLLHSASNGTVNLPNINALSKKQAAAGLALGFLAFCLVGMVPALGCGSIVVTDTNERSVLASQCVRKMKAPS